MFPPNANIIVVGPDAEIPQPHKEIAIRTGHHVDESTGFARNYLGMTPTEHCHQRNDSPRGTAHVYDETMRNSLSETFGMFYIDAERFYNAKNDWRNVMLPFRITILTDYLAQIAIHECCHTMGLVPLASASEGYHNTCSCGCHFMDDGGTKTPLMRLGFFPYFIQGWMLSNERYLEFVFPHTH